MYLPSRLLLAAATLVAASSALAATTTKSDTGTDLTSAASWGAGAPTASDTAAWDSTSLGAGLTAATDITWGSINISGALTNIDISGAGKITTGNITLAGARTLSIANAVALSGNSVYDIADVTGTSATDATLSGVISGTGFGITKTGAGTLVLTGANTYTGLTTVSDGTLQIGNGISTTNALSSGSAVTIGSGATLWLNVAGGPTHANTISGAGTLQVTAGGTGTTTTSLTGDLGSFTGVIDIFANSGGGGKVALNATALSSAALIKVENGATVYLAKTATYANSFQLYGGATTTGEAIGNLRIDGNTVSGSITLFGNSSIGASAATTGTVSGDIGESGGSYGLTFTGNSGGQTIILSGTSTYTGGTTVANGTLRLDYTANNTSKVSATSALTLANSANLQFTGNVGANTSQNIAGLTLTGSGVSTMTLTTQTGRTLSVDFSANGGTISRAGGRSLDVLVSGSGTAQVKLGVAANTTVVPWVTYGSTVFAGTDASGYLKAASTATVLATVNTWTSGAKQYTNTGGTNFSGTVASGITIDGITFNRAAANIVALGTNTLTLNQGVIVTTAVGNNLSTISGGFLQGSASGVLNLLNNDASSNLTISSVIKNNGGATGLAKYGQGIVVLSGANTYTGTTSLNGGVLSLNVAETAGTSGPLGNGGLISFGGGTLQHTAINTYDYSARFDTAENQAYSVDTNGQSVTWASNLTSSGGTLTKAGTGTLILTGANTYTGGTTVTGGTLNASVASSLGAGVATLTGGVLSFVSGSLDSTTGITMNGGALQWSGANTQDLSSKITMVAGKTAIFDTGANNVTFATAMGNGTTAALTKAGAGTLTLSGVNTYTGTTTLSAGTLEFSATADQTLIGAISGAGALIKSGAGILTLTGSNTSTGATTVSGGTLKLSNTAAFASAINNSATVEFNATAGGVIGGALSGAGTFNKTGAGIFQINGGQAITATGQFNIQAGTLQNNNNNVNWSGNTADIDISSGAILDLFADAVYLDVLTGSGIVQNNFGNSSAQSGSSAFIEKLVIGTNNGDGTFSGIIRNNATGAALASGVGNGGVDLVKNGTGTQTLSGANTFTGTTTVSAGTLNLSNANALGGSTFAGGAGALVFDSSVSGHAFTFGGLSGSTNLALVDNAANAVTLTVGANNVNTTYSGALTGAGSLTKAGTGTLTLSGALNYSGATTVSAGTLVLSGSLNNAGGIVSSGTLTATGNITGAGGLTINSGTTTLSGTNTYAGLTTVNGGMVQFATPASFYNSTAGAVSAPNAANLIVNSGATAAFNIGGASDFTAVDITTLLTASTGGIGFNSGSSLGLSTANGNFDYSLVIVDTSNGILGLIKLGANTLTLSAVNTYTGTTTVSAGVLSLNASAPTILGNLTMNGADQTYARMQQANQFGSGVVANFTSASGSWNRFELFGKDQTLAGINTGGASTQGGGVVQNSETSGAAGANATLTLNGSGTYLFNGHLRDHGNGTTNKLALIKSSTGTQTLIGDKITYTGATTVSGGRLVLQDTTGFASATTINGGVLDLNASTATTSWNFNPVLSGAGNVEKTGPGTVILKGANLNTGAFTATAGSLQFGQRVALYNATTASWTAANLTVNAGAIGGFSVGGTGEFTSADIDIIKGLGTATGGFQSGSYLGLDTTNATGGNFAYAGAIADTNGGANALGVAKLGTGTLRLSGASTYTGATLVNSGVLAFANEAALYNNATASWTASNLTVKSGATAAFNVGGAGEFSSADIDVIKGLGTATGGFQNGSTLGFNTTNAGGNFAYASVLANTNGGANALRVNKLGTGTLTLSGGNTYTGLTTITLGILSVDTLANGGAASGVGASSNAAANLVFAGGTLQYTGATASTDRAFTVSAASSLEVTNAGTTLTIANVATSQGGSQVLTKTGAGTLVLGGTADNSSVALAVSSGQVNLNKASSASVHGVMGFSSIASGATVKLTGTGGDQIFDSASAGTGVNGLAGTLDLNGLSESTGRFGGSATGVVTNTSATAATWTVGGANATGDTFAGVIQNGIGVVALTKVGTGTQTLTGLNTYTGKTIISGGTLSINSLKSVIGGASALGAVTTTANGTIDIGTTAASQLTYTGTGDNTDRVINLAGTTFGVTLDQSGASGLLKFASAFTATGVGAKTLTLQGSTAGTGEISGAIVNGSGTTSLAKAGTGTWTLSGANTYTGATTVNGGTLQFVKKTSLYNNTTASWTAANLTVASGATAAFNVGGTGEFTSADIDIIKGLSNVGAATATLGFKTGSILGLDTTNAVGGTFTYGSIIANHVGTVTDTLGLAKLGAGTLTLSGANTYTGVTIISAGILEVATLANGGAASAIGQSTNAAANLVFGSPISTLRYTGSTDVATNRSFTLSSGVGGGATLESSGTGALTVDNTVALAYGTTNQTRTITLGGTNTGANTFAKVIANNGTGATSLIKEGVGTWVLSAANTFTGGSTVNNGTLKLDMTTRSVGGATFNPGSFFIAPSGRLELFNNNALSFANASVFNAGAFTGAGTIAKTGTGTVDFWNGSTIKDFTGLIDIQAGMLSNQTNGAGAWSSGAGLMSVNIATGAYFDLRTDTGVKINKLTGFGTIGSSFTAGMVLTVGSNNENATFDGIIQNTVPGFSNSPTVGLTKIGSGTQTLTGANTYTGATAISGGTLEVGGAGALGAAGTYAGAIANAGVLLYSTSANQTLSGILSGAGSLAKSGSGTLTINGNNTYAGGTTVSAGTLSVGHVNALGNGAGNAVTVTGGTLALGAFNVAPTTIALNGGALTGSAYTGTVNIGGASSISGTFATIASGTDALRAINTTGDLSVGTLGGQGTFSGGLVTVTAQHNPGNSPGTQTFGGGLTYADNVSVNLEIAADGLSFDQIVVNGAALTVGSNVALNVSLFGAEAYSTAFWDTDHTFTLITANSGKTGTFVLGSVAALGGAGEGAWLLAENASSVTATWTAIPEPSEYALIGAGTLAAVAFVRRRRRTVKVAA